MFSCFNSFMREISRMAVLGVPSSLSRWISLSATSSPVWRLRPLNTYEEKYGLAMLKGPDELWEMVVLLHMFLLLAMYCVSDRKFHYI